MATKSLEVLRTIYTVADFIGWQRSQTLVLSPSFQRRSVWTPGAKSFLIDTILRGLPMPIIFLRDQKANLKTLQAQREVIDGQQRIRTVISYVAPELLPDFSPTQDSFTIRRTHNKELANQGFKGLDTEFQQRILDYAFSVHVLPSSVDDREVLQIFARMNATGVKLNDQELRNAQYFGELKTLCYAAATEMLDHWRDWSVFNERNIARMEEVELTSEFFQFMVEGLTGKTQASINRFYADYDDSFPPKEELWKRFRAVMGVIEAKLADYISTSPFSNKTLFFSLFAAVYHFTFGAAPADTKAKPRALSPAEVAHLKKCGDKISSSTAPQIVLDAVSLRTTHVSSRKAVFKYLTTIK